MYIYPNAVNAAAIRTGITNGVYAANGVVGGFGYIDMVSPGEYLRTYYHNHTLVAAGMGRYSSEETLSSVSFYVSGENESFGVGTRFRVWGR